MAKKPVKKKVKKAARKKEISFGTVHVESEASKMMLEANIKSVNMVFSFEEAMKLQVALQAAVLDLNSYDRSRTEGKNKAVNVCYFPGSSYVTVKRTDLPKKKRS